MKFTLESRQVLLLITILVCLPRCIHASEGCNILSESFKHPSNQLTTVGNTPASYETDISAEILFEPHSATVLGLEMRYVDMRTKEEKGPTAVFLHGNGSSSCIWRHVIPHLSPIMRCVAPDLIGMGHHSKPDFLPYRFPDNYTFLSTLINAVIPTGPLVLILHDWGSALGLHWAWQQMELSALRPSPRVLEICAMEFVRPFETWEDFGLSAKMDQAFRIFRTPGPGRKLITDDNGSLRGSAPNGQTRQLTEAYDVYDIATRYHGWLLKSKIPKLLFWALPGAIVTPERAQWYAENMENVETVDLGAGVHNLQEDHPHAMGLRSIHWMREVLEVQ